MWISQTWVLTLDLGQLHCFWLVYYPSFDDTFLLVLWISIVDSIFQMALSDNGLPSIPIWVIMIFSKYLSIDYSNFSLFSDVFWHPKENWLVASQLRKCRGRWRFATSDCHAWSRNWWQGPCSYSGSSRRLWPCLKHGSVDLSRDGEPWDIE